MPDKPITALRHSLVVAEAQLRAISAHLQNLPAPGKLTTAQRVQCEVWSTQRALLRSQIEECYRVLSSETTSAIPGWDLDSSRMDVGKALWTLRAKAGKSQRHIADALENNQSTIDRMESSMEPDGRTREVDHRTQGVRKFAEACGYDFLPLFVSESGFNRPDSVARMWIEAAVIKNYVGKSCASDALRLLIRRIAALCEAASVVCYILNAEKTELSLFDAWGVRDSRLPRAALSGDSIVSQWLTVQAGFACRDSEPRLSRSKFADAEGTTLVFHLPFRLANDSGIMMINWRDDPRPQPSSEYATALRSLSDIIAFVIGSGQLSPWQEIALVSGDTSEFELLRSTSEAVRPWHGVITLHHLEDSGWLVLKRAYPFEPTDPLRINPQEGRGVTVRALKKAWERGESAEPSPDEEEYVADLDSDRNRDEYVPLTKNLSIDTMRSELVVPLRDRARRRIIGVVNFESPIQDAFGNQYPGRRDQARSHARMIEWFMSPSFVQPTAWSTGRIEQRLDPIRR